jgi:hypothetical protein
VEDEGSSEDDERWEDTATVPGDTFEGSGKAPSTNIDGGAVYPLYPFWLLAHIVMFGIENPAVSGRRGVV